MSEHNDEFAALRKALAGFAFEDGKARGMLDDWRAYEDACDPATIARLLAAADRATELEQQLADARDDCMRLLREKHAALLAPWSEIRN